MPTDWAKGILLADLADEPELSEELSAVIARVKGEGQAAPPASAADVPDVVLNFGGVGYLNSSHIAALLRLRKFLMEHRKALVLCAVSDQVWSMIMLTGLDKVFKFSPDTMTALASVQLSKQGDEG